MAERDVPIGRHLTLHRERMPLSDNTKKAVPEQGLHADFRSHFAQYTDFKISGAIAQIRRRLLMLGRKTQTHEWRIRNSRSDQRSGERLHETVVGANGKGSLQRRKIRFRSRGTKYRTRLVNRILSALAQFLRMGRQYHPAPRPNQ